MPNHTAAASKVDHVETVDVVVETIVTPGPLGRFAGMVKRNPFKTVAAIGVSGAAGFVAFNQLRNGGDLVGASKTVEMAAGAFSSILG